MSAKEYRESYFASPDDLDLALGDFLDYAAARVRAVLNAEPTKIRSSPCWVWPACLVLSAFPTWCTPSTRRYVVGSWCSSRRI